MPAPFGILIAVLNPECSDLPRDYRIEAIFTRCVPIFISTDLFRVT